MSNENNNSGCFAIVLAIIAIVVVLYNRIRILWQFICIP